MRAGLRAEAGCTRTSRSRAINIKKTRHLDGRTSKKVQNNSSCPGFQKQAQDNSDTKRGIRKRTGRIDRAGHAASSPDRLQDLTGQRDVRQKKPPATREFAESSKDYREHELNSTSGCFVSQELHKSVAVESQVVLYRGRFPADNGLFFIVAQSTIAFQSGERAALGCAFEGAVTCPCIANSASATRPYSRLPS